MSDVKTVTVWAADKGSLPALVRRVKRFSDRAQVRRTARRVGVRVDEAAARALVRAHPEYKVAKNLTERTGITGGKPWQRRP